MKRQLDEMQGQVQVQEATNAQIDAAVEAAEKAKDDHYHYAQAAADLFEVSFILLVVGSGSAYLKSTALSVFIYLCVLIRPPQMPGMGYLRSNHNLYS